MRRRICSVEIQSAAEQRFFNLEDAVQNQVDLSDAELAALAD